MNDVQRDKNTGADHADRINKNIFLTGKNNTGDTSNNRDKLKPGGLMDVGVGIAI